MVLMCIHQVYKTLLNDTFSTRLLICVCVCVVCTHVCPDQWVGLSGSFIFQLMFEMFSCVVEGEVVPWSGHPHTHTHLHTQTHTHTHTCRRGMSWGCQGCVCGQSGTIRHRQVHWTFHSASQSCVCVLCLCVSVCVCSWVFCYFSNL